MKQAAYLVMRYFLLVFAACYALPTFAQQNAERNLFSAGHAGAFVEGLYDAFYPYKELEKHGDFGLGAPDKIDGEFMMLNGKYYQTRHTGITTPLSDTGKTPYAAVCFFHADRAIKLNKQLTKSQLFACIDSMLNDQNGIYAIHITGNFKQIKTRAFPPATQKPYTPLAKMLQKQSFFSFDDVKGDLIGFKIPEFMQGPAISGYHFHFLSADKTRGGHMADVVTDSVTIEIESLNSFTINLPQTADFKNYTFKKADEDIRDAENGSK